MNLKHLTDKALLEDTKRLALKEREVTLEILHHLKEIDRRKLYADLNYCSLFEYAVKELRYSSSAASRRILSARLLREIPQIEKKVLTGELNLTSLALAGKLFKTENIKSPEKKKEILKAIENKSSRECDKILKAHKEDPSLPTESIKRATEKFTTVKFNFSDETMEKFEKIQDLLSHHRFNYDLLFREIFTKAINHTLKEKFKVDSTLRSAPISPGVSRYISANIKKSVYERDRGQCQKCGSSRWLQYDHIIPRSMGGKTTMENLRLLCANCNQRSGISWRVINKAK